MARHLKAAMLRITLGLSLIGATPVQAAPFGPTATPTAGSLNFPAQTMNTGSAAQTITISNTGDTTLDISAFSLSGDATQFTLQPGTTCVSGASIVEGAMCTLNIQFSPTTSQATGTKTATLTLTGNAQPATRNITLSGTSTLPANTSASLTSTALTFTAAPSSASPTQTVTVDNIGANPLILYAGSTTLTGPNATQYTLLGTSTCLSANGVSVAPNGNCTLDIQYQPAATATAGATHTAAITLNLNTANTPLNISLTGQVLPPPGITLDSPATNTTVTAPGSFTLTATATAGTPNGSITQVEFYAAHAGTRILLGAATATPYTYTWSNVPPGTYNLTAVATDNQNATATSTPATVTVNSGGAQVYYIHADQLDTPRVITDAQGNKVWEWQNLDPFGNNPPNENPSGLGIYTCNLRHPGQYFDIETGLFYNINRHYDPALGRYVESDPIGLAGGVNTYGYAFQNPLRFIDPTGLSGCQIIGPVMRCDFGPPPASSTGSSDLDAAINGGNTSQSSSSSSSTTDSSGAKVSPDAQCMKPPGNCTPQDQKEMQDEVDQACREPRACSPGMDQVSIQVNISNGLRCALARNRINNKCFAGGDKTHRDEAIRVWNTVAKCQGMAN